MVLFPLWYLDHPVVLGAYSCLCSRGSLVVTPGTIWGAGDRAHVAECQCPTRCTVFSGPYLLIFVHYAVPGKLVQPWLAYLISREAWSSLTFPERKMVIF